MGYTHYYHIRDPHHPEWHSAWPRIVHDARRILDMVAVPLSGPTEYSDIVTPVQLSEDGIYLNGVDKASHEPMRLTRTAPVGFGFVKTALKPYDLVVAAILLRAAMLAPTQFELGSDGLWGNEWMNECGTLRGEPNTEEAFKKGLFRGPVL
ncbi:hypothetical protein BO71DRAFT_390651 [Aspergillus ellipticus CBS 707.79]|uniref:Uncharacterized protein n=1 Tax=Aspergillus ellipticus CBS 707.79 TaxID=1448320 RepID=A0A319CUM0_9EURO|nr:hypothetical protein BO71DRAFT_390651 [Aspergillus ellipticus CBS 707.79]